MVLIRASWKNMALYYLLRDGIVIPFVPVGVLLEEAGCAILPLELRSEGEDDAFSSLWSLPTLARFVTGLFLLLCTAVIRYTCSSLCLVDSPMTRQ